MLRYSSSFTSPKQGETSLEHQVGRRVFWDGPKFFKLCPTHFSRGGIASPVPPGYGPAPKYQIYMATLILRLSQHTEPMFLVQRFWFRSAIYSYAGYRCVNRKGACLLKQHSQTGNVQNALTREFYKNITSCDTEIRKSSPPDCCLVIMEELAYLYDP